MHDNDDEAAARRWASQLENGDVPSDDVGAVLAVGLSAVTRAILALADVVSRHG